MVIVGTSPVPGVRPRTQMAMAFWHGFFNGGVISESLHPTWDDPPSATLRFSNDLRIPSIYLTIFIPHIIRPSWFLGYPERFPPQTKNLGWRSISISTTPPPLSPRWSSPTVERSDSGGRQRNRAVWVYRWWASTNLFPTNICYPLVN